MKATKRFFIAIFAALFFVLTFAAIGLFNKPTKTAKAAETTTNIVFQDGASIRLTDPSGVRFTADLNANLENVVYTVNNGEVSLVSGVELGMIVVPAAALENVGTADVFDYLYTTYGKTKEQVSTQFNAGGEGKIVLNKAGTAYCIKGAIVNITNKNYNRPYQAVAYYKLSESSAYVYSAMSDTRTISYVADAALRNKNYGSQETTLTNIVKQAYTLKNPESTTVNVGKTVDLKTVMPDVEDKANYTFAIKSGEANVSLSGSVVTGLAAGEATVTVSMNAYGGKTIELNEIAINVTYPQVNVETEVDAGLDLATAIGEEVASVTYGGENVTLTNGVVELENADAAQEAREYLVTGVSGAKYLVKATVWSLIIDNANEMQKLNDYIVQPATGTNHRIAYFKLGNDIDMTGVTWTASLAIAPDLEFRGLFDGAGKTIRNFNTSYGLISRLQEGTVRNLTIESSSITSNGRHGFLVSLLYGGTFENIKIQANHTKTGASATEAPGFLYGQIYGSDRAEHTYIKNVTLISENEAVWNYSSAFGCTANAANDMTSRMHISNLNVVGFNNVMTYKGKVLRTEADITSAFTDTENVNVYASYYDYATEQANITVLDSVDVDLALNQTSGEYEAVVDFAEYVDDIKTVKINHNAIQDTSVTYGKTEASNVAKVCLIETTDGKLYIMKLVVWSKLIANADDLMAANAYGYLSSNAYYGYFKLTSNIEMAGKTWAKTNMIDYGSKNQGSAVGFQGVLDGNNKTISDFAITAGETALFYGIGENALIKNVSFTNAKNSSVWTKAAILAVMASGGKVEGVSIEMKAMPTGYDIRNQEGIVFGQIYHYGKMTTLKNMTITCLDSTTEYGTKATHLGSVFGYFPNYGTLKNLLSLDGVTVSGCSKTHLLAYGSVGGSSTVTDYWFLGAESKLVLQEKVSVGNNYTTDTNDSIANYVTITGAGLTVDGTTYGVSAS